MIHDPERICEFINGTCTECGEMAYRDIHGNLLRRHKFVGESDLPCKVCNRLDIHPVHIQVKCIKEGIEK